jgi:hypothetical protein
MDGTVTQKMKLSQSAAIRLEGKYLPGLLILSSLFLFVTFDMYQLKPPAASPINSAAIEFSSARAMKHLEVIAKNPRPLGSAGHDEARDYIVKVLTDLDLKPTIQKVTKADMDPDAALHVAAVENIAGRLRGAEGKKALMLVAHYDTVHTSFGASDNGAGVAVLIETARALKAGSQLKNDVIFLFTDGEEIGKLGARAYADDHPWNKDVGVALNFEARGNSGPSVMFETSDQNGRIVKDFAKASPYPISNSILNEIYKRLGNSTDLDVFKEAGYPGMNFAYLKNLTHYHTRLDSLDTIDERSIQHHGSYALPLARYLGNTDLDSPRESDLIYFNLFGPAVILYSYAWGYVFSIITILTFIAVFAFGVRNGYLTITGVILGFAAFLGATLATLLIFIGVQWLLGVINRPIGFGFIPGQDYNAAAYAIGVISLCPVIASIIYGRLEKKIGMENLSQGSLLVWLMVAIIASVILPGASYIFTWPLFFSLIGLGYLMISRSPQTLTVKSLIVLIVTAFPGFLLFGSMMYLMFLGLGFSIVLPVMALLLIGLIIPHLLVMLKPHRWLLPAGAGLLSLGFMIWGAMSGYDSRNPRPDTLVYCLNADTSEAYWATLNRRRDEWTSQFISEKAETTLLDEFIPMSGRAFLKSQAARAALVAPEIKLLGEETSNGMRSLRLRITSLRQAPIVTIALEPQVEVVRAAIDGRQIYGEGLPGAETGQFSAINYFAFPKEGVDLALTVKSPKTIMIRATDRTYGFPEIAGFASKPRPDNFMAAAARYTDLTFVTKSFSF